MADGMQAARRPARAPLRSRSRRRWAVAGGVAACWLVAEGLTGSVVTATFLLVALAGLGIAVVAGLRSAGVTRDHPWLRRIASRPWRDGQAVLNVALRHLPEVLVVTPSGSLVAPDIIELQMSPADLVSLRDWMELGVVSASATEVYEDEAAKRGARFAGSYPPEVYLVPDRSLPQGRYRLRRGLPEHARPPVDPSWDQLDAPGYGGQYADGDDGYRYGEDDYRYASQDYRYGEEEYAETGLDPVAGGSGDYAHPEAYLSRTVMDGMATVMEQVRPAVPVLRLVTGSLVAETSASGARAGRGAVELELPDVPTVSRVHATFTFDEDRWWVTNQGMNGMSVNGVPVSARQALSDGDSIRWGTKPEAPQSRVEIG